MALTNQDLQAIAQLIQPLHDDITAVKKDVEDTKKDVEAVKKDVEAVKKDVEDIKKEVEDIKKEVKDTKLTLENETNRNIQLIAEGHAILNRRLDEALKVESEKELLLLRVNRLENEIRQIKEKLEIA
ncbi:MAG: hypothetical protein ACRDBO_10710 [Lachnospiraceae bacterium]